MLNNISDDSFKLKYLKYKFKYMQLKFTNFGGSRVGENIPFILFSINEKIRKATMGRNYPKLTAKYPKWGQQIHTEGLYLPNEILADFAKLGLIDWYIFNSHEILDITVNYETITIDAIDYFTFKKLFPFADPQIFPKYEHVQLGLFNETKFNFLEYWQSNHRRKTVNEYATLSFYTFLLNIIFNNNKVEMTQQFTKMKELAIESRNMLGDIKGLTDSLFLKYPIILIWGIIFNRFKIILENFKSLLVDFSETDIYLFDTFTDLVQIHIYSLVKLHIENPYKIIDITTPFIEFTSTNRDILMNPFIKDGPDKIKEKIYNIRDLLRTIQRIINGDVRGEDVRGEDVRGEDVRGEDVRGEDVRGEDVRGEDVRGEAITDEQLRKINELSPQQRIMMHDLIRLQMSFDEALNMAISKKYIKL